MGKIIFLDVDGTLVDYENQIPKSAVTAIEKARKNGHRIYLCTGRSKSEMQPELTAIEFDGMIGGNGSYVEEHGHVVMHQTLTPKQCRRVVDWLHSRGLEFYLESNNGLFASEHFETRAEPAMQKYTQGKPVTVQSIFPAIVYGSDLYRDDVNKISFILDSYQDYLHAEKAFPDLHAGTWGGKGELALFGDLGPKYITKAHAIRELVKYLHAGAADTIGIGDAKVDIPMLKCCSYGIAMGNGGPEIRAAADYITDDVNNDGLWKAFQHLKLI